MWMGLAIGATLALAAPAHAGQRTEGCALSVSFGSYAMGIDSRALARIEALLRRDHGVRSVEHRRWGREGEVTLCVATRRSSDARRLAARIRAKLPAKPRGPVTVATDP